MTMRKVGTVFMADTARVMGDVTLGRDTSVWYGSVIRGDVAPITVGDECNIQDNCTLHCDHDVPLILGDRVTLGHGAIVHCVSVGEGTLIGIGAKVLGGVRIGKRCLIAAGAVVPPDLVVPDDHVVMGVPGRLLRETTPEEREYLAFVPPHYIRLARRHVEEPDHPTIQSYAGRHSHGGSAT